MKKIIYYLDRVLSILIVLFFAVFILEGFSPSFNWADSASHLILTLIVLGITIVAWKSPKIGGWFFMALGIFCWYFFNAQFGPRTAISVIPFVTGLLFLVEGSISKN